MRGTGRNLALFEAITLDVVRIVAGFLTLVFDYGKYADSVFGHNIPFLTCSPSSWVPPHNFVKVNFDAHMYADGGVG